MGKPRWNGLRLQGHESIRELGFLTLLEVGTRTDGQGRSLQAGQDRLGQGMSTDWRCCIRVAAYEVGPEITLPSLR